MHKLALLLMALTLLSQITQAQNKIAPSQEAEVDSPEHRAFAKALGVELNELSLPQKKDPKQVVREQIQNRHWIKLLLSDALTGFVDPSAKLTRQRLLEQEMAERQAKTQRIQHIENILSKLMGHDVDKLGQPSNSYTTSHGAHFMLSVEGEDVYCYSGLHSCELTIQYSYTSDYNGEDTPRVRVECDAELDVVDSEGNRRSESGNETDSTYGRNGSGSVNIDFWFYSVSGSIESKHVSYLDCGINGVN